MRKVSPVKLAIAANQNKKERDFWLNKLSGDLSRGNFPFDFNKKIQGDRQMDRRMSRFPGELFLQVDKLSKGSDHSLNVFLAALLVVLLNKYTGSNDVIIGAPIYKKAIETEFINTLLALRFRFAEDIIFKQLLALSARTIVEATDHYRYPIELLPGQLGLTVTPGNFPFFDIVLLLSTIHDRSYIEHIHTDMTFFFQKTGGSLELEIEYDSLLYAPETIERITAHYTQAARSVLMNVDLPISQIDILSPAEKEHIVKDFNDTAVPYAQDKLLHELFEEQVQRTPHNIALIGMRQGQTPPLESIYLTYRELNEQADRLAYVLREKGVKPDTIVGVMIERSIEMILAIYAVLKAGGAYLPIDPDYPPERIHYMLTDSDSTILLTQEKFAPPEAVDFAGETLNADDKSLYQGRGDRQNLPKISTPQNLFYMIYTSGSTGNPKGAMIRIQGFVNLMYWFNTEFAVDHRDCFLLVAPVSFDLAQKNLFSALLAGGVLCLSSPGFPDYYELSRTTAREEVTIINVAPSVFYPMVEFNADDGFRKLRSLRYLFLGGEPIHLDKLAPWLTHENCRCELVNTYGPTECTDISSYYRVRPEHIAGNKNIPIGKPIYNVALFVLDKDRQLLPVGVTGELCIGGDGVAPGYVDRPELTAEKFISAMQGAFLQNRPLHPQKTFNESFWRSRNLFSKRFLVAEGKIYCTGDLVRWLPDGNIEFLGRIDYQVKVRGLRIELGEIEERLLSHEMIKEAVVIDRESEAGEKSLCAYFTLKSRTPSAGKPGEAPTPDELHEYLAKTLPDYMIPLYFVHLETIPLTPSGKVDRRSLPAPESASGTLYAPPRDEIEKKLIEIWAAVLFGREKMVDSQSPAPPIGIDDDFFRLGGHSLKGTVVIARIHKTFDVRLTLIELFKTPYVRAIAALIRKSVKERYLSIASVEKRDYYELSHAQQRLYILDQMEFESIAYNMPMAFHIGKELDRKRLESAFKKLLHRHESFRTHFSVIDDEPKQRIHDPREIDFEIAYHTAAGVNRSLDSIIEKFVRSFDLSKAPLIRAGLLYNPTHPGSQPQPQAGTTEAGYLLLIDMHHIISDGISMEIFRKELVELYDSRELPPLRLQYKDYVQWQNQERFIQKTKKQAEFWLQEFPGEIPVLQLPFDYTRPAVYSFAGDTISFEISRTEIAALKEIIREEKVTFFMILVALLNVLLAKLSGREDIVIGIPAAGRPHPDLENIIGMFINTLALRNHPQEGKRFDLFLQEVKNKTIQAFENQEYQFDDLVESLAVTRKPDRNPIFDVMFVLQNMEAYQVENPGLKLIPRSIDARISKFDLTLGVMEAGDELFFSVDYNTSLFKAESIERFIGYFKEIVSKILIDRKMKLEEIKIFNNLFERRLDNPKIDFCF